ncbi:EVE domain-containing protein [Salipaludibacillus neizhouensis]|uniref:EVE domain-containing protein n=1 Tax=Salipaludibacillus neizhouensis TaxID=885475 RepID=UPI00217CD11B|nr:EVE domain-containing protein [Salipaludibacillus neizhouensis]
MTKYWIGIATYDDVMKAVYEGFAQLCHGKKAPLKKMSTGDWIIYYSSKKNFNEDIPYQKFTAVGKVSNDHIYQFDMDINGFIPFRRNRFY